jgi:hypothetical protein
MNKRENDFGIKGVFNLSPIMVYKLCYENVTNVTKKELICY